MTRLRRFINMLLAVLISSSAMGQNLFDETHSKQYAQFLLRSQQFELATLELERLVFMDPESLKLKQDLAYSYRKAQRYADGLKRMSTWKSQVQSNAQLSEEWVKSLIGNRDYQAARAFTHGQNALSQDQIAYYELAAFLLTGKWERGPNAPILDPNNALPNYAQLNKYWEQSQDLRYKKPGVALGLSALVPGLGKVYANDWKDGLISLLFVATNTWQAYRGFKKDGVSSVYGWIFGTMAVGFYSSNLYGSWKSAKDYNSRINDALYHEIEHSVLDRF